MLTQYTEEQKCKILKDAIQWNILMLLQNLYKAISQTAHLHVAGSVVRGEATATSDLDVVIINDINEKTYNWRTVNEIAIWNN